MNHEEQTYKIGNVAKGMRRIAIELEERAAKLREFAEAIEKESAEKVFEGVEWYYLAQNTTNAVMAALRQPGTADYVMNSMNAAAMEALLPEKKS